MNGSVTTRRAKTSTPKGVRFTERASATRRDHNVAAKPLYPRSLSFGFCSRGAVSRDSKKGHPTTGCGGYLGHVSGVLSDWQRMKTEPFPETMVRCPEQCRQIEDRNRGWLRANASSSARTLVGSVFCASIVVEVYPLARSGRCDTPPPRHAR